MYFVYVLKSIVDESTYLGQTKDLERRLEQHNRGVVASTKSKKPYVLVYYEAYMDRETAVQREQQLKRSRFEKLKLFERIFAAT